MSFMWAILFNTPHEDIKHPAFIKLCLIPIKIVYQAVRGNIDIISWRKTLKVFKIDSIVDSNMFVSGPKMPPNLDLLKMIDENPASFYNRLPTDDMLLSLGYGVKLSFNRETVTTAVLGDYIYNFELLIRLGHNHRITNQKEYDRLIAMGVWPETINLLMFRNDRYADSNMKPSFLTDYFVRNGLMMKFSRELIDYAAPAIVDRLSPGGEELELWRVALDKVNLEALDVYEDEDEVPQNELEYLGFDLGLQYNVRENEIDAELLERDLADNDNPEFVFNPHEFEDNTVAGLENRQNLIPIGRVDDETTTASGRGRSSPNRYDDFYDDDMYQDFVYPDSPIRTRETQSSNQQSPRSRQRTPNSPSPPPRREATANPPPSRESTANPPSLPPSRETTANPPSPPQGRQRQRTTELMATPPPRPLPTTPPRPHSISQISETSNATTTTGGPKTNIAEKRQQLYEATMDTCKDEGRFYVEEIHNFGIPDEEFLNITTFSNPNIATHIDATEKRNVTAYLYPPVLQF